MDALCHVMWCQSFFNWWCKCSQLNRSPTSRTDCRSVSQHKATFDPLSSLPSRTRVNFSRAYSYVEERGRSHVKWLLAWWKQRWDCLLSQTWHLAVREVQPWQYGAVPSAVKHFFAMNKNAYNFQERLDCFCNSKSLCDTLPLSLFYMWPEKKSSNEVMLCYELQLLSDLQEMRRTINSTHILGFVMPLGFIKVISAFLFFKWQNYGPNIHSFRD